ncbi:hypothetical protein Q1695_009535 [Nippostrongylus brasiliensis]|nr:hypothetical protein Q1695_009535 [Nippostrongylus brasiliensis]
MEEGWLAKRFMNESNVLLLEEHGKDEGSSDECHGHITPDYVRKVEEWFERNEKALCGGSPESPPKSE